MPERDNDQLCLRETRQMSCTADHDTAVAYPVPCVPMHTDSESIFITWVRKRDSFNTDYATFPAAGSGLSGKLISS